MPAHDPDRHRARRRRRRPQPGRRDRRTCCWCRSAGRRSWPPTSARCAAAATAPTSCSAAAVMPAGSRTAAHLLACLATLPVSVAFAAPVSCCARLEGWEGWPRIEVFARRAADRARRRRARRGRGPMAAVGRVRLGRGRSRTFVLQVASARPTHASAGCTSARHGNDTSFDLPEFQIERHGWHLVYLVGATLLVAAVALLRSPAHRHPTRRCSGAVVTLVVASGSRPRSGRPPRPQAEPLAGRLEDPRRAQDCDGSGAVTYCSWPRYASWREAGAAPSRASCRSSPTGSSTGRAASS